MFTWEDPPDKVRSKKWDETFRQIKEHSNKWAKLFEGKDRNAHSFAGRLRKDYPEYEIKSQTLPPIDGKKQAGVWARFNAVSDEVREALDEIAVGDTQQGYAEAWDEMTGNDPYDHGGSASLDG